MCAVQMCLDRAWGCPSVALTQVSIDDNSTQEPHPPDTQDSDAVVTHALQHPIFPLFMGRGRRDGHGFLGLANAGCPDLPQPQGSFIGHALLFRLQAQTC